MKTILLALGVSGLFLGGCATYQGGTAEESGVVQGDDTSYYYNRLSDPYYGGRVVYPIYKQPSPTGNDMGDARPDLFLHR